MILENLVVTDVTQLDDIRLVKFTLASQVLGIDHQLANDWLWKEKYPIRTCKINGLRYVLLRELREFVNKKFSQAEHKDSCAEVTHGA